MTTVIFGSLTALLVALWGVLWYRQQLPAAVARVRLERPARPRRPRSATAPAAGAGRLVPLTRAPSGPEIESIEEPFYAAGADTAPRRPLRHRRPALTPIPDGPPLAVEPLTADERLGDYKAALPPAEPVAPEPIAAAVATEAAAVEPPPAAEPVVVDDLAAIEEPFFAAEPPPAPKAAAKKRRGAPAAPPAPEPLAADDLAAIEEPFFAAAGPPPAPEPLTAEPAPSAPEPEPIVAEPEPAPAPVGEIAEPFFGVERAPEPELVGYCARCQAKRTVRDVHKTTTRKGRPALRGHCAVCGAGMFIFTADAS